MGWRTVIIEDEAKLGLENGTVAIKRNDSVKNIPIDQVGTVVINSNRASLSARLISELAQSGVKMIFCNEKKNPCCEVNVYGCHTFSSGNLFTQLQWTDSEKKLMWQKIVTAKITNQHKLLDSLNICRNSRLQYYADSVEIGDTTNREGQAAGIYFNMLFGSKFVRHRPNNINAALNYGYTILLSAINRLTALHGYNTCIGINHCNKSNSHNLSCDLIEVFRPIVYMIVYKNSTKELDRNYKKQLIGILYQDIRYEKKKMDVQTALEQYVPDLLRNITNKDYVIKDVDFE